VIADEPLAVLELSDRPESIWAWAADVWAHRDVLLMMSKADFQVRYKRASFGVLWAVVVPLLQAVVVAVVFAKVIHVQSGFSFAAFVMSGVLPWGYFAGALAVGSTAIVDGSGLTDKVWFPRALLVLVPCISNLVGLAVSLVVLVAALPVLGVPLRPRILLLLPACVLLVTFTAALSLVLSALHVYFRDVRFLVQAALLVWFYVTPLAYPITLLGKLRPFIECNPMTGVITVFHLATVGSDHHWALPLAVAVGTTLLLLVAAAESHRRHDRLFVDLL
jgi:ABC-type polysaccharide/polyol phosphate export permease